jgi:hypothetical protein
MIPLDAERKLRILRTSREVELDTVTAYRQRVWHRRQALPVTVIVVAFLHGLFYAFAIPPWDLFDEEQHLAYVLTIRDERRIPHLEDPIPDAILESAIATDRWRAFRLGQPEDIDIDAIGLEGRSYEAYQPPLTYILLAPLTLLARTDTLLALYTARLAGVVLYTCLAAVTWSLSRQWFPDGGQTLAAVATLILTGIPAGAQAAGRVTNDLLAALLISAGMLAVSRYLDRPYLLNGLILGVVALAAVLAKAHGVLLLPLIVVALIRLWWQKRLNWQTAVVALLPGCLAAIAWSAWTYSRYGVMEGSRAYLDRYQTYQPLSPGNFLRTFWLNSWSDYWGAYRGEIGGGSLLIVTNLILIALVLTALAFALRHHRSSAAFMLTGALALGLLLALAWANQTAIARPGGRLLLPLYPAAAILIAASWQHRHGYTRYLPVVAIWSLSLAYIGWWFLPFFYAAP